MDAIFLSTVIWGIVASLATGSLVAETRTTSNGEEIGILIMGTIVDSNNKDNVALIKEVEAKRTKAVKVGFKVLDKYTVSDVQPKFIVLKTAQGDIHLVYQDTFSREFIPRKKTVVASNSTDTSYSEDGFERKDGTVQMTSAFRDKIVEQDLSKILMQATAVPHYEDGALKGFRLLQIDRGSIFENGGFLDDDVITAINGTPLSSIPGAIKKLHSLKNESGIQIEFMRKGSYKTLSISVL